MTIPTRCFAIIGAWVLTVSPVHGQEADWAERVAALTTHNEAAFQLGPRLVDIPRETALDAVRTAWPSIEVDGVKTGILKAFHFAQHPDVLDVLDLGATDVSADVREYAFTYLRSFAWRDFVAEPESYAKWRETYAGKDVEDVLHANVTEWIERFLRASTAEQERMRGELEGLSLLGTPNTKTYRPSVLRYARQAGMPDELFNADTAKEGEVARQAAENEPPSRELFAGDDKNKRYFLIGGEADAPADGFKVLVVVPGGDGGEDFQPFVRRLAHHWLPPGYLVAQLVAPQWKAGQFDSLVWPIATNSLDEAGFTTEAFIDAVVTEVRTLEQVNVNHVFVMGWSSGGPPSYAATLSKNSQIRGAFILASVFKPDFLPNLAGADGKSFFILHSPDDFIPIRMAEQARDDLQAHGAVTLLETYPDGHGWPRKLDVVARGLTFLERD